MKMEEKLRRELELEQSLTYNGEAGLEFYETIEAPKFVDFTRPNHFCPDDRYWFCSRVGCNQEHEEEMDSESIYKNFVLRVMAARSPNVRFRRALSRKPLSDSKKCPMSAPPKPSKSRIPRLALVSSISKKLIVDEEKGTIRPAPAKPDSTPKARVKHVAAKYMTSPRKKKAGSPNPNAAFRSVRNPLKTSITIPKNKVVAKALLFGSPKKAVKSKTLESATPVTKLCEGVKKLAITSEKKGITQKPFKESTRVRKLLPSDASRKQQCSSRKAKAQKDLRPVKGPESSKCIKVKTKKHDSDSKKLDSGGSHDAARSADDYSDMEIDGKSRADSVDLCLETVKSGTEEKSEENSRNTSQKEPTSCSERPLTAGSSDGHSSATLTSELIPVPESEGSEQQNFVSCDEPSATDQNRGNKSTGNVDDSENQDSGVVGEPVDNYDKENIVPDSEHRSQEQENHGILQEPNVIGQNQGNTTEDDLENQNPRREIANNSDKENALNSNNLRNVSGENLSKNRAPVKKIQKLQKGHKTLKENCPAVNTQGVKYKKLKPTNPKPFRLRTDERGILKEATLERKVHSHENSTITSENSQCTENGVSATREKWGKKVEDRTLKKVQFIPVKSKYRKTSKEAEPMSDKGAASCTEKKTGRTKPPVLQNQRPQRVTSSRAKPRGLTVTDKTATLSKPRKTRQEHKEVTVPTNKASVAQKSVAQGRKPVTVPREPIFHTLHKPKSCTSNIQ